MPLHVCVCVCVCVCVYVYVCAQDSAKAHTDLVVNFREVLDSLTHLATAYYFLCEEGQRFGLGLCVHVALCGYVSVCRRILCLCVCRGGGGKGDRGGGGGRGSWACM